MSERSSTHTFKVAHEDLLPLEVPSTTGQSPGAHPRREKATQPRAEPAKGSPQCCCHSGWAPWPLCLCLEDLEHNWPIPERLCPACADTRLSDNRVRDIHASELACARAAWLYEYALGCYALLAPCQVLNLLLLCEKCWGCAKLRSCPGTKMPCFDSACNIAVLVGVGLFFFFLKGCVSSCLRDSCWLYTWIFSVTISKP